MQYPCQDITPRTLTLQIKTDDVKLKLMTLLIGLALRYFARDVKLTAAANGFLKSPILFYYILSHFLDANNVYINIIFIKHAELKEMDEKWLDRSYY